MKELLFGVTEQAILVIDAMALVIVVVGTIEAFIRAIALMLGRPTDHDRQALWLRYASWLVGALTFQLAADVIETSITMEWDALTRIAIIALIRTFLNYFLGRDVTEIREREKEGEPAAAGGGPPDPRAIP